MITDQQCIDITRCWIEKVVIGQNFCPFARYVFINELIEFSVKRPGSPLSALEQLTDALAKLQSTPSIETTLIIYPDFAAAWDEYLDYYDLAQRLLTEFNYEGVFQLASFHPDYCFQDATSDDAANYTNRSPFPILHILREASLTQQIEQYPDVDAIPDNNIKRARSIGADQLRLLLKQCTGSD